MLASNLPRVSHTCRVYPTSSTLQVHIAPNSYLHASSNPRFRQKKEEDRGRIAIDSLRKNRNGASRLYYTGKEDGKCLCCLTRKCMSAKPAFSQEAMSPVSSVVLAPAAASACRTCAARPPAAREDPGSLTRSRLASRGSTAYLHARMAKGSCGVLKSAANASGAVTLKVHGV
eukprot:6197869-Pleurochrysis_carterae.AAC.1